MTAAAFLYIVGVCAIVGLVVLGVTAWMERSPESKAFWDGIARRVL